MIPRKWPLPADSAKVYAKSGIKAAVAREIEMRKQLGKRRYQDPAKLPTFMLNLATRSKPLPGWIRRERKNPAAWSRLKSSTRWTSGTAIPATSTC